MVELDAITLAAILVFSFVGGVYYHDTKATKEATQGHICSFCFQPVNDDGDDYWWEDDV